MPTKKATKKAVTKKTPTPRKASAKKTPTKKTTRTTTAKKTSSKSTSTKKKATRKSPSSKKPVVYAEDQKSFWTTDGRVLNSLIALRDALDEMEKDVYLYHATGDQNDFAAWVDAVLCDDACARDLAKAKTPRSAKTAVVRHLKTYTV